jgi:hypothetical protein
MGVRGRTPISGPIAQQQSVSWQHRRRIELATQCGISFSLEPIAGVDMAQIERLKPHTLRGICSDAMAGCCPSLSVAFRGCRNVRHPVCGRDGCLAVGSLRISLPYRCAMRREMQCVENVSLQLQFEAAVRRQQQHAPLTHCRGERLGEFELSTIWKRPIAAPPRPSQSYNERRICLVGDLASCETSDGGRRRLKTETGNWTVIAC